MALSPEDAEFARELFSGLGGVTTRRMFGGLGLYRDGTIFALMRSDGVVMLKGAGAMAERMDREGWQKWTYTMKGRTQSSMPYWHLPDDALDDPDRASALARDALACL